MQTSDRISIRQTRQTRSNMQRKNFLFKRPDFNEQIGDQQTSKMLFRKSEFKQVELCKFNSFSRHLFEENTNDLSFFTTPPMNKKSIATPQAPVKNKKQSKKVDLKPKRLQFTEEELDASSAADSGICVTSDQSSNALFCKQQTNKRNKLESTQKQIRTLHTRVDKIKIQVNDKENDRNIVENRSESISDTSKNIAQVSSLVFNPTAEVLSQCNNNFSWRNKLYWLQNRRDVGLWIECCRKNCKKWRYVNEYHDPLDVPKIWYCEMNSDKSIASCDIPEKLIPPVIESDLIENAYNAGSIVWAYIHGFPWWPGIINDSPETFTYYVLPKNCQQPKRYYITFFNEEKCECAWVHKRNIKPFATNKYSKLIKKTIYHGINYKNSLERAYEVASSALPLSILERLQKFSYVAQYQKFYDINNNSNESTIENTEVQMSTNSDDEISPSYPTKDYLRLKDYYSRVLSEKQNT
ncbi:uncharacterized protein LOC143146928 isoform X2 [Ptiloglossa arizonensis]|uniref:uncharacterized protein LOC143146928 isoform X2 n=1 Tax=Ptiloglossa arizonensis TaxID=3350558 RepID=UPI003F9FC4D8